MHLVHIGSAAEYGIQGRDGPVPEYAIAAPGSAYGVTKLEATERLTAAAAHDRISVTVLRVFNPLGRFSPPSTLPGSAARQIDAALRSGARSINLGALDSRRDYIDTRDVARAVLAAASTVRHTGSVLNVGRGEAVASRYLVESLAAIAGYDGEIVETSERSVRSARVSSMYADIKAISRPPRLVTPSTASRTRSASCGTRPSRTTSSHVPETRRRRHAVPAYFHPQSRAADWARLAIGRRRARRGEHLRRPGHRPRGEVGNGLRWRASATGGEVVGYVDTGYLGLTGLRTHRGSTLLDDWLEQILREVGTWYRLYGDHLTGIFLDQVAESDDGASLAPVFRRLPRRHPATRCRVP